MLPVYGDFDTAPMAPMAPMAPPGRPVADPRLMQTTCIALGWSLENRWQTGYDQTQYCDDSRRNSLVAFRLKGT